MTAFSFVVVSLLYGVGLVKCVFFILIGGGLLFRVFGLYGFNVFDGLIINILVLYYLFKKRE